MLASRTFQGEAPLADASLLRRCERARQRAVALGYRTAKNSIPKTVVQGETRRVALAKCERWETFVAEHTTDDTTPQPPSEGKGPRYIISPLARPCKCSSCGARIFWTLTNEGKKVPADPTGYSHFTTCPNASSHSKKNKPIPDRSGLPKHIKHLWAVVAVNGLDSSDATRAERIQNANAVLIDHGFAAVKSWSELGEDAARVLSGCIDAKILTWGTPVQQEGEAA